MFVGLYFCYNVLGINNNISNYHHHHQVAHDMSSRLHPVAAYSKCMYLPTPSHEQGVTQSQFLCGV